MAAITFRFTTECEMTISAATEQEAYLKFKDFLHGDSSVQYDACVSVFPPETDQVFFKRSEQDELHEIAHFKGSFIEDFGRNNLSAH